MLMAILFRLSPSNSARKSNNSMYKWILSSISGVEMEMKHRCESLNLDVVNYFSGQVICRTLTLKTVFYFLFCFNLHFFCLWWICRPHGGKHKHASFSLQLVHNLLRTHWYARHCSAPTSYSLHWHSKKRWGENDLISMCVWLGLYVSGTWVTFVQ